MTIMMFNPPFKHYGISLLVTFMHIDAQMDNLEKRVKKNNQFWTRDETRPSSLFLFSSLAA